MAKKLILEFEEISLSSQEICKRESYKEPGLYLVNDGIARFLAMVTVQDESFVSTIPIPIEELEKHKAEIPCELTPKEQSPNKDTPKGEWVSAETLLKVITQLTKG